MTKSITSKLIALLTLCTAVIVTVGMAIDYQLSRTEIMTRLQLESSETVSTTVADLENWLTGIEGVTQFFGKVLEQRDYSHDGLKQMLRDVVEQTDEIYGAAIAINPALVTEPTGFSPYYYKKDGILSYANLANGQTEYWRHLWYTDAVEGGVPIWVEPYFDEDGARILMTTFSVPVFRLNSDGQRHLYAVVTADVALDELHQYLQRIHIGESGFGILLSRQGIILSSKNSQNVMRHHKDIARGTVDVASWNELFEGALNGQPMSKQLECPQITGTCTVSLSALKSTGWPVGVVYSEDEMLAPLREYQFKTALLGLLTVLIMALTVTWVTRRLTLPLTALATVTDQIAQGILDVPLPRIQGDDEVARLIRAFAAMKLNLKAYISDLESASAARSRLEAELATAKEIQMAMLPQGGEALEQKADYVLWAKVRPAKTVGGDLYTYYCDSSERMFIALGDVSDKGIPAALFMAKTISHIQQFSEAFIEPAKGMALLNNALETGNSNCMFVTLFFGVLNPANGELCFASAGHTPPSLVRNGHSTSISQESGPALGLVPDLEFPANTIQLLPGDRLAIYTDGIDEAFNEQAQMFGYDRMNQTLEQTSEQSPADAGTAIIHSVDTFAGTTPQSDDITLMLLDIKGKNVADPSDEKKRSFTLGPQLVSRSAQWLRNELQHLSSDETLVAELLLVAEEIVTNIHKYAGLEDNSEIEISLSSKPSDIELTFTDAGVAFDPLSDASGASLGGDIESAEIGGLGVHLIKELTGQQQYQRLNGNNILRIRRSLS